MYSLYVCWLGGWMDVRCIIKPLPYCDKKLIETLLLVVCEVYTHNRHKLI